MIRTVWVGDIFISFRDGGAQGAPRGNQGAGKEGGVALQSSLPRAAGTLPGAQRCPRCRTVQKRKMDFIRLLWPDFRGFRPALGVFNKTGSTQVLARRRRGALMGPVSQDR